VDGDPARRTCPVIAPSRGIRPPLEPIDSAGVYRYVSRPPQARERLTLLPDNRVCLAAVPRALICKGA
jgi:hypothetical protein